MLLFSADSIIIFIFSIPEEQAISYDSPIIISIRVDEVILRASISHMQQLMNTFTEAASVVTVF